MSPVKPAKHTTYKRTAEGKRETLARKNARALKRAGLNR